MKRVFMLMAMVCTLASCKKDKLTRDLPARYSPLALVRYYYNYSAGPDFYADEYAYSSNRQLNKIETRNQGVSLLASRSYYYTRGLLSSVELDSSTGAPIAEFRYVYAGGCNAQKFQYLEYINDTQLKLVTEHVFEYNAQGQPVKTTVTDYNTGNSYYILTTFSRGNVAKQVTYTLPGNTLKDETVYEYDNKRNPYYKQEGANTGNPRFYSVNNITRMTTTSAVTGLVMNEVYEYDYNAEGLPAKQYNVLNNKKVLYAHFEYK